VSGVTAESARPDPPPPRGLAAPGFARNLALRVGTALVALALVVAALVLGPPWLVLAILVSWGHEQARERGAVRPALGWSLVGTAAVGIGVDLLYLAYSLLDGMVHLLLFLILLRLFARRGLRDLRDAGLLSFFMLVAAASISFSLGFLLVYITFLLLGTWMLILNHVVTELEQAGWPGDTASACSSCRTPHHRSGDRQRTFDLASTPGHMKECPVRTSPRRTRATSPTEETRIGDTP
jgi:hypothetical protein